MKPTPVADTNCVDLRAEAIARARAMSPAEKLLAGEELFHMAAATTLAGVRHQFPDADEQQAIDILKQQRDLLDVRDVLDVQHSRLDWPYVLLHCSRALLDKIRSVNERP